MNVPTNTVANERASTAAPARRAATRDRIDRWLVDGPIQRDDGAVGGWLDASGVAAYVYPEITGYYLQWLAWRAKTGGATTALSTRATAAQRWLCAWQAAAGHPPTRVYTMPRSDWRNHATFAFDHAMVLRGVAAAARWRLLTPDPVLVAAVTTQLCAMIGADGALDAVRIHTPCAEFPARWSTRRGPFLAKAAAGIVYAAGVIAVPGELLDAAAHTFTASLLSLRSHPHTEAHPLLYAIEGFLACPSHREFASHLPHVAACFDRLIERSVERGSIAEADDGSGVSRLDVVAQALRAGTLLAWHRRAGRANVALHALESALLSATTADGAVPFVRDVEPLQRNAWATMFASQALAWLDLDLRAVAQLAMDPLVV